MSTSRLKKAIENSDNHGLGNLLESFCDIGTPLPSLDSKAKTDKNEFKPIWEQEVVDEKGRKRLHGAFTGGWSAGHFNTVGSKEGWTPSTFKSSRAVRASTGAKSASEAAEAFMDEEDLADLASARTLQTAATYAAPTLAYDPLLGNLGASTSSNSIEEATATLASLIQPSASRIGAKLMRKMGWRDCQGVGPRITVEQRRKQAFELGLKVNEESEDQSEEASRHYYAPLDRPLASLKEVGISTDKGWGLGYKAGPNVAALTKGGVNLEGSSTVRATAFDDDDEDDDDVYSGGSTIPTTLDSREKKKWGVVDLDDERDNYRISSSSSSSRKTQAPPSRSQNSGQIFHDGTSILVGFKLNEERTPIPSTSQLPPPPPRDWLPNPQRIWDEAEAASSGKGKGKQLDADERGSLLGEKLPPPPAKSVFEYLSTKSKERLANLNSSGGSFSSPSSSTSASASSSNSVPLGNNSRGGTAPIPIPIPIPEVPLSIPSLDGPTALAALKGFQPFSNSSTSPDPARQARYTLYLQFQAHLLPPSNATLPFGPRQFPNGTKQTIAELNKELDDYAKSARVFKPVSGMLAGRFTSGGSGVILPPQAATPGFYQPKPKALVVETNEPNKEEERVLTPAQTAVKNDMFGNLTRTIESWKPVRLICKRFGVPVPYSLEEEGGNGGEGGEEEVVVGGAWKEAGNGRGDWGKRTGAGEVLGKASMEALIQSSGFRKLQPTPPPEQEYFDKGTSTSSNVSKPVVPRSIDAPSLANVGLGDDEAQGAETLTYTKAPKDIFAAIFADSDDEDEDSDEEVDVDVEKVEVVELSKPLKVSEEVSSSKPGPPPSNSTSRSKPSVLVNTIEETNVTLDSITFSTYRPNFVPPTSSARTKEGSTKEEKEKKKSKKRKAAKATLSFDIEEGEEESEGTKRETKFIPKKRKVEEKVEKKVEAVEEEEVWVEVPPIQPTSLPVSNTTGKRARASDLY